MAITQMENIQRLAAQYKEDPDAHQRLLACRCKACYYTRSIAGAACTIQACACCHAEEVYGSTRTDVLCIECAKRLMLCKHCGGDLEMSAQRLSLALQAAGSAITSYSEAMRHAAISALRAYIEAFPDERRRHANFLKKIVQVPAADFVARGNMSGHITCSAFVIDFERGKILLIDHKTLKRVLQPGGHPESDLDLWLAAMREAIEETGIVGVQLKTWCGVETCPLDIDTHKIPANLRKGEGAHVHHDFGFLFSANSTLPLVAQKDEVDKAEWRDLDVLYSLRGKRFARVARKLSTLGFMKR